jgi:hypothetical protein
MHFKHALGAEIDLYNFRTVVPGGQPLVFIGSETFAHHHHLHPTVFGMVRYAGGELQVNVDHHLKTEFKIDLHGSPPVHGGDLIL